MFTDLFHHLPTDHVAGVQRDKIAKKIIDPGFMRTFEWQAGRREGSLILRKPQSAARYPRNIFRAYGSVVPHVPAPSTDDHITNLAGATFQRYRGHRSGRWQTIVPAAKSPSPVQGIPASPAHGGQAVPAAKTPSPVQGIPASPAHGGQAVPAEKTPSPVQGNPASQARAGLLLFAVLLKVALS